MFLLLSTFDHCYSTACASFVSTCALPWALGHLHRTGIHLALPAFQIKGLRIPSPLHSICLVLRRNYLTSFNHLCALCQLYCIWGQLFSHLILRSISTIFNSLTTNPLFCACQDSLLRQLRWTSWPQKNLAISTPKATNIRFQCHQSRMRVIEPS